MEMTSGQPPSDLSRSLTALALRLKSWRRTRRPGQRIPEDLWSQAVRLAHIQGLSPVSTALQLNYYDLQRRLGMPARARKSPVKPAHFVELPSPVALERSADSGTLELTRSNGSRLILRLPTSRARDLLLLVQTFLRT